MSAPAFADDVLTNRVHPADWDNVYVVGDIHGCRDELETLLDRLAVTDDDLVLFVGDLVRKGPDNAGVVELVRAHDNFRSVRGNNEEKVLRGEKTLDDLTDDHLDYLASLPVALYWGEGLVVHGGVDPRKPLAEHSVDDLQNARSLKPGGSYGDTPYWFHAYEGERTVFFGHSVLEEPILRENAVGLDTGCVYGESLTAYHLETGDLTTVDSTFTEHAPRPESKKLSPHVATAD